MKSAAQCLRDITASLRPVLGEVEAKAAAALIMEDVAGYDRRKIFTDGDRTLTDYTLGKIDATVAKIVAGQPVQYAVGKALFMGNYFRVNPSVLIPRPETAGLVDMIVDRYGGRHDLRVLDIGTGSGCIAISLARALPFSQVTGVDISAEALETARSNASDLKAKVDFQLMDILGEPVPTAPIYDIVVSNPPYITQAEESSMDARVARQEPPQALFVPDDDPMLFYRAIARYAAGALVPGGAIFFEINRLYPTRVAAVLRNAGFENIETLRDYKGNPRYATATLPQNA